MEQYVELRVFGSIIVTWVALSLNSMSWVFELRNWVNFLPLYLNITRTNSQWIRLNLLDEELVELVILMFHKP